MRSMNILPRSNVFHFPKSSNIYTNVFKPCIQIKVTSVDKSALMMYRSGLNEHSSARFSDSPRLYSPFRHGTFGVYTARSGADYYSEAIKGQFGVGRLSGHLKGHSTRRIVGCIEMDGAAKAEPASLVWKCARKILGVATNLRRCPQQNIDAKPIVSPWALKQQQWIRAEAQQHLRCIWSRFFCIYDDETLPQWIEKPDEFFTESMCSRGLLRDFCGCILKKSFGSLVELIA